ncbi:hypothetical protein [Bradyrhizobium neotropicale]|uniref:hypothetical protein n=1 Tax=Bradyrhizobium neotropicale TaxID=1497615 RepID=UPI001AD7951B|nr:hypothetical protein [Bradyrhizobium neotropicale]
MQIDGGYIQCFVDIGGTGPNNSSYSDHQIYTWEIGKSPQITTGLQKFVGRWFITGSGNLVADNGVGTVNRAHWYRIVQPEPAPLNVRLSGNEIIVGSDGAPMAAPNARHLWQQLTISGQPQTPGSSKDPEAGLQLPTIQWTTDHVSPFWEQTKEKQKHPTISGPMQPNTYPIITSVVWRIEFYFG